MGEHQLSHIKEIRTCFAWLVFVYTLHRSHNPRVLLHSKVENTRFRVSFIRLGHYHSLHRPDPRHFVQQIRDGPRASLLHTLVKTRHS
jgi:hypothetical protein